MKGNGNDYSLGTSELQQRKSFFVDIDDGRWYIKYDKTLKKWLISLNGKLRAKADSLQSAQDFVAIELAKALAKLANNEWCKS